MNNKNCILLVAHITNTAQLSALTSAIASIRTHAPEYPIFVAGTGDIQLLSTVASSVDHFVITSVNKLHDIHMPIFVWFNGGAWTISHSAPLPRKCYGFAQLQKTAIGLQAAMVDGYENFLVMNYDILLLEDGFIDYMFSESSSIFFNFPEPKVRMSSDVFKLNLADAKQLIAFTGNEPLYNDIASQVDAHMLEDTLGRMIELYRMNVRLLPASSTNTFQIAPFKVLINNVSSVGALAGVVDGTVHLLVSSGGHPAYTTDGKLEIGHNGQFVTYDVSRPMCALVPITQYTGEDVPITVRTSFGEFQFMLYKHAMENTTITFH